MSKDTIIQIIKCLSCGYKNGINSNGKEGAYCEKCKSVLVIAADKSNVSTPYDHAMGIVGRR